MKERTKNRAELVASRKYQTVGVKGLNTWNSLLVGLGFLDIANGLASQTSFPSWGYWLTQGATTCWENWSGEADASHPPEPTRNHIFLCGGVGQFLTQDVGGIQPMTNGMRFTSLCV